MSGYYAWRHRPPSGRAQRDATLLIQIQASHQRSDGTYGAPRILEGLREHSERVGQKRVARLMRQAGLVGVHRRRGVPATRRAADGQRAPDLVRCNFTAVRPNQLWVADITYVPTWAGFLYLAIDLDVYSRRIVGWAMASHLKAELVLDALTMAITQRRRIGATIKT